MGPAGNPKLLVIKSSQDMKKCSPHGRDCIENKSTSTFDCSVACEGIYADVQWVENVKDKKLVENDVEKKLSASNDEDLLRLVFKEIGTIKGSISKGGDELDRKKYLKLISEYKHFKNMEVQHFRFDVAAHATAFGNYYFNTF